VAELVELDPRVDERWQNLVERLDAPLFHAPEWSKALADTYGWSPRAHVVLDSTGLPIAGLPWCRVSDPAGERIVSLPFSDFGGPIGAPPFDELFDALDRIGLPVRCRIIGDPAESPARAVVGTARWHGIRVTADPADAWSQLSASARRAVNKARREGVSILERGDAEFVPQFLRIHTGVRKGKYHLLPQPLAFFLAIRSRFDAIGGWYPLVAARGDELLATTVYLRCGSTLFYKFNASNPATLGARPNDLLVWAGIELASRLGCRCLDFGASDDDQPGLIRFKRGFGSEEREIRVLASGPPLPAGHSQFRALLTDLTALLTDPAVPDAVAEQAGDVLYRYFA
jgi:CelD/BcsL family acetyltransferase involved in cellulose biosynthesis